MNARQVRVVAIVGLLLAGCDGATPTTPPDGTLSGAPAVQLILTARNIAFEPATLTAPTGFALAITFDNLDPGTPHGLVVLAGQAGDVKLAEAPVFVGPDHRRFEVGALIPGEYRFSCVVHPNMTARLTVNPG